jgi:hypothetical protein
VKFERSGSMLRPVLTPRLAASFVLCAMTPGIAQAGGGGAKRPKRVQQERNFSIAMGADAGRHTSPNKCPLRAQVVKHIRDQRTLQVSSIPMIYEAEVQADLPECIKGEPDRVPRDGCAHPHMRCPAPLNSPRSEATGCSRGRGRRLPHGTRDCGPAVHCRGWSGPGPQPGDPALLGLANRIRWVAAARPSCAAPGSRQLPRAGRLLLTHGRRQQGMVHVIMCRRRSLHGG